MKKLSMIPIMLLTFLISSGIANAATYSKAMAGFGFGNEDVCFNNGPCVNDSSSPKLDTDAGYYFYVTPIAVRKELQGDLGVRLESEFSVSKRKFDLSTEGRHPFSADGDDTRYSFGGNVLLDMQLSNLNNITPYAGVGFGVEYSKLRADFSMRGRTMQASTHDDFRRYHKYIAGIEVPIIGNVKGVAEYNYRKTDRFTDVNSPVNWELNDEHIANVGLSVYW